MTTYIVGKPFLRGTKRYRRGDAAPEGLDKPTEAEYLRLGLIAPSETKPAAPRNRTPAAPKQTKPAGPTSTAEGGQTQLGQAQLEEAAEVQVNDQPATDAAAAPADQQELAKD